MKKLIYENSNIQVGKYKFKTVKSKESQARYEANGWITLKVYEDEDALDDEDILEIEMCKKCTLEDI